LVVLGGEQRISKKKQKKKKQRPGGQFAFAVGKRRRGGRKGKETGSRGLAKYIEDYIWCGFPPDGEENGFPLG